MDNFVLVRPEYLNHYGYLFGGVMLKWVDEFAWIAASREFSGCNLVTVALDNITFKERVNNGSILRFNIARIKIGHTSAEYEVTVYADLPGFTIEKKVFTTKITFVNLDENGKKKELPSPKN